jgi:hypothetical protein
MRERAQTLLYFDAGWEAKNHRHAAGTASGYGVRLAQILAGGGVRLVGGQTPPWRAAVRTAR